MASYNWTVVQTDLVGDTGVQIVEDNIDNGMQILLDSIAIKKYKIKRLKIFTVTEAQLDEPVGFQKRDVNGDTDTIWFTPIRDLYSFQSQYVFDTKQIILTEDIEMQYKISGNTSAQLQFTMDDDPEADKTIGNLKILQATVGKGALFESALKTFDTTTLVKSDWNIKLYEPEEEINPKPNPYANFDAINEMSSKSEVKYAKKPIKINSPNPYIVVFLAVTTGVLAIYAKIPEKIMDILKTK